MKIQLYTDGGCSKNPGPGGWAYLKICMTSNSRIEEAGYVKDTTNNRMELQAVIEGLKSIKETAEVELFTDSTYVGNGLTDWMANWKKKGWQRYEKGKLVPIKNADLWQELDRLKQIHNIKYTRVAGHSGHPENDRVDELAVAAYQKHMSHNK